MRRSSIFSEPCIDTGPSGEAVIESLAALARLSPNNPHDTNRIDNTADNWTPGAARIENLVIANGQLGETARIWGRRLLERLEGPEAPPIVPGDPNNLRIFARRNRPTLDISESTGRQEEGIVSISPMSPAEVAAGRLALNARSEPSICDEAAKFLRRGQEDVSGDTASDQPIFEADAPKKALIAFKIGHRITRFAPTGVEAGTVGRLIEL